MLPDVSMKSSKLTAISAILLLICSVAYAAPPLNIAQHHHPKILLAIPDTVGFPFWLRVKNFAQVVSKSLKIQLHVITFDANITDRDQYTEAVQNIVETQYKPDFIVSMLWLNGQSKLLDYADEKKIPIITINNSYRLDSKNNAQPRTSYSYWYGHISPNDHLAGYQLAKQLIKSYGDHQGNLIALTGDNYSAPSFNRVSGLKNALSAHPKIKLSHLIYTDWTSFDSRKKTQNIIKSDDKSINIVWTASDFIALGSAHALEQQLGSITQMQIGSIDWNKESISMIRQNKLDMSYGGHFIEAGKALILAYDFLHGHDFIDELGTMINTELKLMNKQNVEAIDKGINFAHWKNLDFKHLSKTYNPQLKHYTLDIEAMLQFEYNIQ